MRRPRRSLRPHQMSRKDWILLGLFIAVIVAASVITLVGAAIAGA